MKKAPIFILLYSSLLCASVCGSLLSRRDVWMIEPHHSWLICAINTSSGELSHVSRQLSRGQHSNIGGVSGRSFSVSSGGAPDCMNCTSSDAKIHHRSKFRIAVYNAPDTKAVHKAVKKVAEIMGRAWSSKIPVDIRVAFGNLGAANVLANGGGTYFCRIRSLFNQIVPIAAGEAILGRDLNQHKKDNGKYDVLITINTEAPWYYGTDRKPPSHQYDLVTVLLHEVYHNLLFSGGIFVDVHKMNEGVLQKAKILSDHISRFDAFLANKDGCAVLGYLKDKELKEKTGRSGDVLLADALTNEQLYFGTGTVGDLVRLYAPKIFRPKTSIYRLDTEKSSDNSIMTAHEFEKGRAQHVIGARILKIQALYLDGGLKGAKEICPRPLLDPKKHNLGAVERKDVSTASQTTSPYIHAPPVFYDDRTRMAIGWVIGLSCVGGLLILALCAILGCVLLKMKADREDASSSSGSSLSASIEKTRPPLRVRTPGYRDRPYITPTYSMLDSFRVADVGIDRRGCPSLPPTIVTPRKKTKYTIPSSTVPPPTPTSVTPPLIPTSCVPPPTPSSVAPPSIPPPCKKIPRCQMPPKRPPPPKPASIQPPSTRSAAPATVDLFDCS